jgi:predicted porin
MKKLVIAAAVLGAFAGTAQAQSSVTLFGVVDTNVTHINASGNPDGSRTFEDNSGINSSRIGVRGTEDLGGGLKAGFWLEAGINSNNGSGSTTSLGNGAAYPGEATGGGGLTFNRRSTVSLISDRLGELRVGRDYVPTFWNSANVDPFGYNGIAEQASFFIVGQGAMGATAVRASNGVSYLTPNTLGGFFLQATYAFGGNPNNVQATIPGATKDDGDYAGVNIGYQNGPIYAGLATSFDHQGQTASVIDPTFGAELGAGDVHVTNFGASYDFGFIKPDLFLQTATVNAAPEQATTDVASIGFVVPLGQGEFRFNYGHAKGLDYLSGSHANLFGVGYVYNLSKRTAVYVLAAKINNSGEYAFPLNGYESPAAGENTSGVSLGVRTSF